MMIMIILTDFGEIILSLTCYFLKYAEARFEQECWQLHQDLERGNPIRIYRGEKLQPSK